MNELFFSKEDTISKVVTLDDSLKWENEIKMAKDHIEKGFSLIWEIKLDLFSFPLSDEATFRKNSFTLEYFKNSLYTQFEEVSKGVILYRGKTDFSILGVEEYSKKGFKIRFGLDYLKTLASVLPESLALFLLFEEETLFLAEAIFDIFHIATKKVRYQNIFPTIGWDRFSPFGYFSNTPLNGSSSHYKSAILFPKLDLIDEDFVEAMESYLPRRVIPEAVLTDHWHEIETLFVFPELLSSQGHRKLEGFKAAGGKVELMSHQ